MNREEEGAELGAIKRRLSAMVTKAAAEEAVERLVEERTRLDGLFSLPPASPPARPEDDGELNFLSRDDVEVLVTVLMAAEGPFGSVVVLPDSGDVQAAKKVQRFLRKALEDPRFAGLHLARMIR